MSTTTLFHYETHFLNEALGQLKDYLLSDEVYWQLNLRSLHGAAPYPQLTLGNLLFSQAKLDGLQKSSQLSPEQKNEVKGLATRAKSIKTEWRSAWEKKAEREFQARLTQWGRYLGEMSGQQGEYRAYYATEVRVRAVLELLAAELPTESAEGLRRDLSAQDQRLEQLTSKGAFVWDAEVQAAFPAKDYPFLYRQPKGR